MADHTLIGELYEAEQRLQAAQLAGDVEELDRLLDEQLVFTGPPDSRRCSCGTERYPAGRIVALRNIVAMTA